MALTVAEQQSAATNTSTTLTFTLGAGSAVGDLLVLIHSNNLFDVSNLLTPTGTAAASWTLRDTFDGGAEFDHIKIWTAPVTTAGAQTVIASSSTVDEEKGAGLWRIPGGVFDVAGHASGGVTTTAHVAPSLTPTSTDDIYCCLWTNNDSSLGLGGPFTYTYPGAPFVGLTQRSLSSWQTYGFGYEPVTSGVATGTRTATASATHEWAAAAVLIKAAPAAPVTVRDCTAASIQPDGNIVVPAPAGLIVGDLMIAWHYTDNDGALAAMGAPTGWSLLGSSAGVASGYPYAKVWRRVATSADVAASAFTFTNTAVNISSSAAILAISTGTYDTVTPTSAVGFQSSATSATAHIAPSVTGVAGGLLCTSHGVDTNGTAATYTAPSGMTERADTNAGTGSYLTLEVNTLALVAATATGTKTATCSTSRPWQCSSLVINPSTAAPIAPSVVEFVDANEDARGTTNPPIVIPPTGYAAGDLLLAFHVSDTRGSLAAMTADAGWTEIANNSTRSTDVGFIKIWRKTATAAETDYTFSDSLAATSIACVVALTGWDITDAFAVDPTWNSGAAQTTHVAPSVNGVVDGMLLTAHIAGTAGTTRQYTSGPTGMTLAQDVFLSTAGFVTENVYYQTITASGPAGAKIATLAVAAPFVAVALVVQPPLDRLLQPIGIITAEAFGTATLTVDPLPLIVSITGIASAEAFGVPDVSLPTANQTVSPTGIATAEAFGVPVMTVDLAAQTISAVGIPSAEAIGIPAVALPPTVSPVGIASAEAIGSPLIGSTFSTATYPGASTFPGNFTYPGSTTSVGALGFGSAPFGTAPFGSGSTGQIFITVSIDTGEAFGTPGIIVDPLILPDGIFSAETFGTPAVAVDLAAQTVTAVGIDTGEAFGVPLVAGEMIIGPDGIATGEGIGLPVVTLNLASQTVNGVGILSSETFGFPAVTTIVIPPDTPPDQTVFPTGIGSAAAFGGPVMTNANTDQIMQCTAVDSAETFGTATVTAAAPLLTISPAGIPSAEAFGNPARLFVFLEVTPPVAGGNDTYYIDGVDLTGFAWRITTAEGLQLTPGVLGEDVVLPGRDGAVEVYGGFGQQRRPDAIGRIVFDLWLKGVSASTGLVPGGSTTQAEWFARWDELVRLFHRRRVTIDHVKADGSIRRATGHLLPGDSIGPVRDPSSPWFGRVKATFAIPAAHWLDTTPVTTGQQSLTTGSALSLAAFSGATAACTELTVTFGAGSNPRLSTSWGHIGWNNVIAAGRQVGIDTITGTTNSAAGTGWTPGYDALTYAPGPRLFEIDPSEALTATLTHTGGGSMTVEVAGKRRYRTA